MTVSNVLLTTKDYALVVGEDHESGQLCYQLYNIETRVTEASGPQLASAMMALYSLQDELDKVRPNPKAELDRRMKENPFAQLMAAGDEEPDFSIN